MSERGAAPGRPQDRTTSHPLRYEAGRFGRDLRVVRRTLRRHVLRRRDSGVRLEVPDEVGLVGPAQLRGLLGPTHGPVDVDALEQCAHPQNAGQGPRAQPYLLGELPVEMAMTDAEFGRDLGDRPRRLGGEKRDCRRTPLKSFAIEGPRSTQRRLDQVEGLVRCLARQQRPP